MMMVGFIDHMKMCKTFAEASARRAKPSSQTYYSDTHSSDPPTPRGTSPAAPVFPLLPVLLDSPDAVGSDSDLNRDAHLRT